MNKKLFVAALLPILLGGSATGSSPGQGQLERAVRAQSAMVEQSPTADGYNDLGNLLLAVGRVSEAEDAYRTSLSWEPGNPAAWYNLALLFRQQGKVRAALRELENLVESHSDHAWAWYSIGALQESKGRRKAAVEAYAKAFRLEPSLSFPDVNPQVVDNELMVQALLEAYDEVATVGGYAPRQFGSEGGPILSLEASEPEADETERESLESMEGESGPRAITTRSIGPEEIDSDSRLGQATPQPGRTGRGGRAGRRRAPRLSDGPGAAARDTASSRTRATQRSPVVGTTLGGRAGGITTGETKGESEEGAPSARRGTFRPSPLSTGRLELELVPFEASDLEPA